MNSELAAWSKLLRENFVICLLFILYLFVFGAMMHMSHDQADKENVAFVREAVTAVAGCLFGMLTKNVFTGRGSGEPAATTTTETTVRTEGGTAPLVPPKITVEMPQVPEKPHAP